MINYDFTYNELLYFLLIFVRVASFVFVAPFFSMGNTPARIRAGLSFFITLLLYHTLPETEIVYNGLLEYTVIVMKEVVTGLLLGFGTNFCTSIMSFAGQIVDMDIGLSMASMFDPTTKQQTSISGVIYNYMIMLMLIISGMYRYLLSAFVEAYTLIPINGTVFRFHKMLTGYQLYDRFCDHWIPDLPAGFYRDDSAECHSRCAGKGVSAAEYVCGWYPVEDSGRSFRIIFIHGDAA